MSLARLEEDRRIWAKKPVLRLVYGVWFDALLALVPDDARVVEVGAGPGLFAAYARERRPDLRWTSTELQPTRYNDVVADAARLPFAAGVADAVLAVDVVHHLAAPRAFFREARRVLAPGGVVAVVEPWVTPLSHPIYRWLHAEGCDLGLDPWQPFASGDDKQPFDGDAAVVYRQVKTTDAAAWRALGFAPPEVRVLNGFAYLLSLGFQPQQLLPAALAPPLLWLDRALGALARWFGVRALVSWRRSGDGKGPDRRDERRPDSDGVRQEHEIESVG